MCQSMVGQQQCFTNTAKQFLSTLHFPHSAAVSQASGQTFVMYKMDTVRQLKATLLSVIKYAIYISAKQLCQTLQVN